MKSLIEYRTYNQNEIPVLTIPKGTVLFRYISDKENAIRDFVGFETEEDKDQTTYCLSKYHNTFFYPYPYVIDSNSWVNGKKQTQQVYKNMILYEIAHDCKIILMIKPSEFIRKGKYDFTTYCNNLQFCNKNGIKTDICLTEDFIDKNPDISGIYAIQEGDANNLMKWYTKNEYTNFRKYLTFFRDINFKSVPEIMMHPLLRRNIQEQKTVIVNGSEFDYIQKHKNKFNYHPFQVFEHKPLEDNDELSRGLKYLFDPRGLQSGKNRYHLTIDKRTLFYVLYESLEKRNAEHFVQINEKKKLAYLRKKTPFLLFTTVNPENTKQVIKGFIKQVKKDIE
jgi:hypothetical protein